MKFESHKVGLITAVVMALMHALWSLLVFLGLAQTFLDWILSLHFLRNPYIVNQFELSKALTLLVVVFIAGYLMGYIITAIWNKMIKK